MRNGGRTIATIAHAKQTIRKLEYLGHLMLQLAIKAKFRVVKRAFG